MYSASQTCGKRETRDASRQPMAMPLARVSVRVNKVLVSNQRSGAPASRIDRIGVTLDAKRNKSLVFSPPSSQRNSIGKMPFPASFTRPLPSAVAQVEVEVIPQPILSSHPAACLARIANQNQLEALQRIAYGTSVVANVPGVA